MGRNAKLDWVAKLLITALPAVWIGGMLRGEPAVAPRPDNAAETVSALRAAGLQVTPVVLPRLAADPWSLETAGDGTHLRVRLSGVSRPVLRAGAGAAADASVISADLYVSTWKVVAERGRTLLLVDIRVSDPLGGEPLWSTSFLAPAASFDRLESALQQALSEAFERAVERQRPLITV